MSKKLKVTVTKDLYPFLEYLFITALEGGSDYWCFIDPDSYSFEGNLSGLLETNPRPSYAEKLAYCLANAEGFSFRVLDVETEDLLGVVSLESLQKNIQALADSDQSKYLFSIMDEEGDAEDADVVFQYCVMGEVVYG